MNGKLKMPAQGIANGAKAAHEAMFKGGGEVEPLAGLWTTLEGLAAADDDRRRDALGLMGRDVLVLLAAQAEVEVRIDSAWRADLGGDQSVRAAKASSKQVYLDAADKTDDELRSWIIASVERLAEVEWAPRGARRRRRRRSDPENVCELRTRIRRRPALERRLRARAPVTDVVPGLPDAGGGGGGGGARAHVRLLGGARDWAGAAADDVRAGGGEQGRGRARRRRVHGRGDGGAARGR
jgi:hypothetical protein